MEILGKKGRLTLQSLRYTIDKGLIRAMLQQRFCLSLSLEP